MHKDKRPTPHAWSAALIALLSFVILLTAASGSHRADAAAPTSQIPPPSIAAPKLVNMYFRDRSEAILWQDLGYDLPEAVVSSDVPGYLAYVPNVPMTPDQYLLARSHNIYVRVVGDVPSSEPDWDPACYRAYDVMLAYLNNLVTQYPNLAELTDIGDSWCKLNPGQCSYNGFDIWRIKLTNRSIPGPKPKFHIVAAHHAREIATPELALQWIQELVTGYGVNADATWLLDNREIYIVPVGNPDGWYHAATDNANKRKNDHTDNRCNLTTWGVDLNRNYDIAWSLPGASSNPCDSTYYGTAPNSEPETTALINEYNAVLPNSMITMHTYGPYVLYPWGYEPYNQTRPVDEIAYDAISWNMGRMTNTPRGNVGNDVLYQVSGAVDDWTYDRLGIPSFTVELGGYGGFNMPCSVLPTVVNRYKPMLTYMAKATGILTQTTFMHGFGPSPTNLSATVTGTTLDVSAVISANYGTTNGAIYSIDTFPEDGIGTPMALTGQNATASVDVSAFPTGRHTVYVQGKTALNYFGNPDQWGIVSALFFTTTGPITPMPTSTVSPNCFVTQTGGSSQCAAPSTFSYTMDFTVTQGCSGLYGDGTIQFQASVDVAGPWVTLDQTAFQNQPFGPGTRIEGTFNEPNIPEQYIWYRVLLSGVLNNNRPVGGQTDTAYICSRAPLCPSSWNDRAPFPMELEGQAATVTGNMLYSFGGSANGPNVVANAYRYDPDANTWTQRASMPQPRYAPSAVTLNGHIYVLNGADSTIHATNTAYRYDPASNTWTSLSPGLMSTYEQSAVVLNGNIYRIGGYDSAGEPTNTVEIYGQGYVAPIPQPLANAEAMTLNGYIYLAGGSGPNGATTKTYRYDPVANEWSDAAIADLPTARVGSASGLLGGQWIMAGGDLGIEGSTLAWDPQTDTWSGRIPLLHHVNGLAGGVIGSSLYVIGGLTNATQQYDISGCPSITVTPTASSTSAAPTNTPSGVTNTPAPPTSTPPPCYMYFEDVPPTHVFYPFIRCLFCRNVLTGYSDGTFRPNAQVTRGQLAKIVSNSAGFNEAVSGQTFQDVPSTHTFYVWIERLTTRGYMTGYQCGGPGEPCVNNKPYFRPQANATRGQAAKIVSNAASFTEPPVGQTFEDVSPAHTFYEFIQRLATRNVMSGYNCGGPGEPCISGKPYFRPGNDVTRGQSAKIVANTFFPGCAR